jgi:hypothetical protein
MLDGFRSHGGPAKKLSNTKLGATKPWISNLVVVVM